MIESINYLQLHGISRYSTVECSYPKGDRLHASRDIKLPHLHIIQRPVLPPITPNLQPQYNSRLLLEARIFPSQTPREAEQGCLHGH